MSNHDQRGRTKGNKGFVNLPFSMITSPAFLALPPLAVTLYVHVASRYTGDNNGNISYSTREASSALRVGKNTAATLFDELVANGFLKVAQDSSFSYKKQTARRWELTQWPLKHGTAPSNDWRFWKPAHPPSPANGVLSPAVESGKRLNPKEAKCSG